jgi:hypothetical protein
MSKEDKISSNRNYKTEGTKSKTPNKIPKSKEIMRRQIRNHPNRCKTLLGNLSIKRSATKGNGFMKEKKHSIFPSARKTILLLHTAYTNSEFFLINKRILNFLFINCDSVSTLLYNVYPIYL